MYKRGEAAAHAIASRNTNFSFKLRNADKNHTEPEAHEADDFFFFLRGTTGFRLICSVPARGQSNVVPLSNKGRTRYPYRGNHFSKIAGVSNRSATLTSWRFVARVAGRCG